MVKSNLGQKVTIEVWNTGNNANSWVFPARGTFDSVVVNWGRDSLYSAPRNRTASVIIGNRDGFTPAWWLCRKISIKVGDMVVFMGTIDHARNKHHIAAGGNAIILVELDAVEGGLFNPVL